MLVHLPRMEGCGIVAPTKNGPSLGGHGAVAMKDALAMTMTILPEQLRRSLTWDRGKELAQHAQFRIETGTAVYFADPHSPWQRGTNKNTNGLLRQYFPKGTNMSWWGADDIEASAAALNSKERKEPGMEDPGRGSRRAPTIASGIWCCNHRLKPVSFRSRKLVHAIVGLMDAVEGHLERVREQRVEQGAEREPQLVC